MKIIHFCCLINYTIYCVGCKYVEVKFTIQYMQLFSEYVPPVNCYGTYQDLVKHQPAHIQSVVPSQYPATDYSEA